MIGIVWYKKIQYGQTQLQNILQNYEKMNIKIQAQNSSQAILSNGDYWYLIKIEPCCGVRCNVSYVDCEASNSEVESVIMPSTSLPPYNAIRYY